MTPTAGQNSSLSSAANTPRLPKSITSLPPPSAYTPTPRSGMQSISSTSSSSSSTTTTAQPLASPPASTPGQRTSLQTASSGRSYSRASWVRQTRDRGTLPIPKWLAMSARSRITRTLAVSWRGMLRALIRMWTRMGGHS